jgi:23S rRNA A2030 N6-methylase RlmJ
MFLSKICQGMITEILSKHFVLNAYIKLLTSADQSIILIPTHSAIKKVILANRTNESQKHWRRNLCTNLNAISQMPNDEMTSK